jgi:hypothetical protein
VTRDLRLARIMGWTYDDVADLPADVYDILIDDLAKANQDTDD